MFYLWKQIEIFVETGMPLTTEIVLRYESTDWQNTSGVRLFTYKLHASGTSLVPTSLSSAMYLLVLKLLHRYIYMFMCMYMYVYIV